MRKEALAALVGYFKNQRKVIDDLVQSIRPVTPAGPENTSHLGYLLHNLYCAVEDLFRYVSLTFENTIADTAKYHRELLKRMHIEVPEIRPRVISEASFRLLDELRGFRHVFRHAYEFQLAPEKVADLKGKVLARWQGIEQDFDAFVGFLVTEMHR